MTRLVDRIEEAGLVRRTRSPEDRRGVYVEVTASGREKRETVWSDHVESIERHFGRYVDAEEATVLQGVTTRIREVSSGSDGSQRTRTSRSTTGRKTTAPSD
jgi:DNA-binding MarR family transcriptional regulator